MTAPTIPERVAIVDLADDLQIRKQRIFKILPRLGIVAAQRREPSRGNQNVATVSATEAATIRAALIGGGTTSSPSLGGVGTTGAFATDDVGFFYFIQLEPDHDPGRFKLGFTMDLDGRLQKHRCSAPYAAYLATWPCRRVWERAAIDCITKGCEQLHTEVFRTVTIGPVIEVAAAFFGMMPSLIIAPDGSDSGDESQDAG